MRGEEQRKGDLGPSSLPYWRFFLADVRSVTVHRSCSSNPVLFESCKGSAHGARGTSRNLTLDGVNLVIQLDPMHLKQPWLDVLKERKHEHSRRRASISRVCKIGRTNFPLFHRAFRYPRSPSRPPITQHKKISRSIV
ncbi:hypothetical protein TNCV_1460781 [Trichonephila clavipes]|nr:hypothetical protein TNCV_1460781 [Trichonephila clavipes]